MRSLSKVSFSLMLVVVWLLSSCGPVTRGGGGGGGGGGGPILVVNSTNDVNDGTCNTTHCSLREAILAANALPEPAKIKFDIGGGGIQTIQLTGNLPALTAPMTIDGTTQPGYANVPLVVLDGTQTAGEYADGLLVVGGNTTIKALVIKSFSGAGIHIATNGGNTVTGCYIFNNAAGSSGDVDVQGGIWVQGGDANTIGGMYPGERNEVSGNRGNGIFIGSNNNSVIDNYIGTDATGFAALGNSANGILVAGNGNKIGGMVAGYGNLISDNGLDGVLVTGGSNEVQGNRIGTSAGGDVAFGNHGNGVTLNGDMNLVGGTDITARNIISGNLVNGVNILAGSILVQGNYIGTDVTGTVALGNQMSGVYAFGMGSIQIGGSEAGAMNVISANQLFGVYVEDASSGVSLYGNRIGTDRTGTTALGNIKGGVRLAGTDHELGASFAGGSNLISGNHGPGVAVTSGSTGILIRSNFIGTDITGTAALGNSDGLEVGLGQGDTDVTIGGATFGQGNLVSGNNGNGLLLYRGATVLGNRIGLSTTEATLGNGGNGILIKGPGNTIGGTESGAGNAIANNSLNGIAVISESGGAITNPIWGNSIHDNGKLGIAVSEDAVIANDPQDADSGDNNRQNYPVLISAVIDPVAGNTTYHGTLNSTPGTVFMVQIYSDAFCDPSGYGEGRAMVHSFSLTTNVSGQAIFNEVVPFTYYEAGNVISSTATDPGGNTSEFSNCIPVTDGSTPTPTGFYFTPKVNANCRLGPDLIFGSTQVAMKGQAYLIDGRNLENTWLYIMLMPQVGCWVPLDVGTPSGDTSKVRVLFAVPTPTPTSPPPTCAMYKSSSTCLAHPECTWVNTTASAPFCKNK